jgi:hypothetical protein
MDTKPKDNNSVVIDIKNSRSEAEKYVHIATLD